MAGSFERCLANGENGRNEARCTRSTHSRLRHKVQPLVDKLDDVLFPTTEASHLPKQLARRAVCGITGWHQNKASEVSDTWEKSLLALKFKDNAYGKTIGVGAGVPDLGEPRGCKDTADRNLMGRNEGASRRREATEKKEAGGQGPADKRPEDDVPEAGR